MGSILIMISFLSVLIYSNNIKLSTKMVKILSILIVILAVFAFSIGVNVYNKNTIGYIGFMLLPFSMIFIETFDIKKVIKVLINIFIAIFTLVILYYSDCRSALYAEVAFIILNIIQLKNEKLIRVLSNSILLGGIVFVFIYIIMWNNNINLKLPFTNKNLYTGREYIWTEALVALKNDLFFGIGSKYEMNSISSLNLHNSLLNMLCVYGLSGLLFYIVLLTNYIKKASKKIKTNKISKISYWALICIFIVAYSETNLIWNMEAIFLILIILFIFNEQSAKDNTMLKEGEYDGKVNRIYTSI